MSDLVNALTTLGLRHTAAHLDDVVALATKRRRPRRPPRTLQARRRTPPRSGRAGVGVRARPAAQLLRHAWTLRHRRDRLPLLRRARRRPPLPGRQPPLRAPQSRPDHQLALQRVAQHLPERRHRDGAHRSRGPPRGDHHHRGGELSAPRGGGATEVGASDRVPLTAGGRSKILRFLMSANTSKTRRASICCRRSARSPTTGTASGWPSTFATPRSARAEGTVGRRSTIVGVPPSAVPNFAKSLIVVARRGFSDAARRSIVSRG